MNTTTFTIESVHGVKQTFVLNIQDRAVTALAGAVTSLPGKEKPSVSPIKPDITSPQNVPATTRN
jgi:hypothetical protein